MYSLVTELNMALRIACNIFLIFKKQSFRFCGYCRITFKVKRRNFVWNLKLRWKMRLLYLTQHFLKLRRLFCKNHEEKFLITLLYHDQEYKIHLIVFVCSIDDLWRSIFEGHFYRFCRDSCSAFHPCHFHNVSLHADNWFNFLKKRKMWYL